MHEVELKFFDIDIPAFVHRIEALGAKKIYDLTQTSVYFEHLALGIRAFGANGKSLRLRVRGDTCILSYKGPLLDTVFKMQEETEFTVSDFEKAKYMLLDLGFKATKPIVAHRTHYKLHDFAFEIDTYAGKKPYLEVEATSKEALREICAKVGLDISQGSQKNASQLFPELFVLEE